MSLVVVFIALIFFHSLVSRRIERNILTAPVLFTAAGVRAFLFLPGLRERQGNVAVMKRAPQHFHTRTERPGTLRATDQGLAPGPPALADLATE